MNSFGLHASPLLAPALSPRLQHAVRLLQMSSLDFSQVVRQQLDANPFLEAVEDTEAQEAAAVQEAPDDGAWDDAMEGAAQGCWDLDPLARGRAERSDGLEGGVFDTLEAGGTLAGHLAGQLRVLNLSERDAVLALALAHSLDDDGYLRQPLHEVGDSLGLEPPPDEQEMGIALRRLQALDPAGVGARSVPECLLLQLAQSAHPQRELAAAIVREHLDVLARHDAAGLARRVGAPREAVEAACQAIRQLDPHPGWRHGSGAVPYVTPDVIVRRRRGQWVAMLNPAVIPRVRLNRQYAELFNRCREAGRGELGAHLQEAKWTVRNVEQRFSTILSVARAILQRQHRFLAYGPMAMKPLALREIAQAVGAHESTVSRVTNNKFMATPMGVFELKYFFSRGLSTASGGTCSPTAIRSLIREMIDAEPAGAPLSDVALARQLGQQGLQVARRTVTKYRQQLRIEPADRRACSRLPGQDSAIR